ncbi:cysteine--tRNA ligase [Pelagibacterium montanilacus]|uniref:cysteine--tRNA ligase n=1 Tax=Pelagibacterium montanilacus TaxID=2185280 RepID=UPI000F8D929F|nr:cysteine--tRNA ligase [Pelagibacterium montanilacus]
MSADAPALRLHNTLTRARQDFAPIDARNVRMYVCGPTVYDFAHIGNARPVIVFDVLFRLLRHVYGENHVTYVRNITDVDDKINARAARDFPDLPLNDAIARVTETTAAQFHRDVAALGCLAPTHEPRATAHIPDMIAMIETLVGQGHAYAAGGEVLFRVGSMEQYGRLSGRNLEDNIAGARVAVESHKENPADFVLWKASDANEPGWESPWGRGRPGWHIECSAMSKAFLGDTFDIHGGGLDLIFPHHENEIAQSCCANQTPNMANVWMHNGYLQVEGRKMSKSEGNFVTIHDLLETEKFGGRTWPGEVLRLAMLMTHYREPIDFSVARLEEAENIWTRVSRRASAVDVDQLPELSLELQDALLDDLRISDAIRIVVGKENLRSDHGVAMAQALLKILGVGLKQNSPSHHVMRAESGNYNVNTATVPEIDEITIISARDARLEALAAKDFAKADAIRAELLEQGIQLMDYKDPETGERRTKWEVKR